jgi:hypothetical protein
MDSGVEKSCSCVRFGCAYVLEIIGENSKLDTQHSHPRRVAVGSRMPDTLSQNRETHSKGMVVPLGAGLWWLRACFLMDVESLI